MMLMALLSMGIALVLIALLYWLLFRPSPTVRSAAEVAEGLELEELFPLHCRHFPQIHQAFSRDDDVFMRRRASRPAYESWRANRRRVLRLFLVGLNQDFGRLAQLARAVAALSPEVSRTREFEQLWLILRFRLLYHVVALRARAGRNPLPQMTRLAELVGSFAAQVDAGMAALEKRSASNLGSTFSV